MKTIKAVSDWLKEDVELSFETDIEKLCIRLIPRHYKVHADLRRLCWSYYLVRKYGVTKYRQLIYVFSLNKIHAHLYYLSHWLLIFPNQLVGFIQATIDNLVDNDIYYDWDNFIKGYGLVDNGKDSKNKRQVRKKVRYPELDLKRRDRERKDEG